MKDSTTRPVQSRKTKESKPENTPQQPTQAQANPNGTAEKQSESK